MTNNRTDSGDRFV